MTHEPGAEPGLTSAQRWAIAGVILAAACLFGYGVAGSYASVTHLAAAHRLPLPRLVPVGIDGGLVGTVLLDIVLTWSGYPVWWLRWLARLLTIGTIAANATAGWPDPVSTGLHLAAPVMLLAVVEATRSVLLRRPVTTGQHREPIPVTRWLLAPWPTWKLWRRMVLWQITSYQVALGTEQRRLHAQYRLRHRYGPDWRSRVPDDLAWMLRDGVMMDEALERIADLTGEPDRSPEPADRARPAGLPDEELVADMRLRWPYTRPSRESVRIAYHIGSGRARRVLNAWASRPAVTERERAA